MARYKIRISNLSHWEIVLLSSNRTFRFLPVMQLVPLSSPDQQQHRHIQPRQIERKEKKNQAQERKNNQPTLSADVPVRRENRAERDESQQPARAREEHMALCVDIQVHSPSAASAAASALMMQIQPSRKSRVTAAMFALPHILCCGHTHTHTRTGYMRLIN